MIKHFYVVLAAILVCALGISGCSTVMTPVTDISDQTELVSGGIGVTKTPLPPNSILEPTTTTEEEPLDSPERQESPQPPDMTPLPVEPLRIEFIAEDGTMLVGLYYPASVNPAPLVVLHHWARGDKNNWLRSGTVQWLTNRGMSLEDLEMTEEDYHSLYPSLPEGVSFGVFIYDFRGFGESELENKWYPDGWRMDAQSAMKTAQQLPGVDTSRIASIGSSIGADGSVIGCLQGCSGAISLSPGNYLTRNYSDVVLELEQMGTPVLCFAAEGDGEAAPTCRNAVSSLYDFVIYPDSAHGNNLLTPGRVPEIGQTIRDFLLEVFHISE